MTPTRLDRRRGRPSRRVSRGFTLLEVLVACALLAVLAVIGWRGLEAVLSARDRITAYSDDLRAMTVAFSQIDEDLRRSWPVRLMRLPRRPVAFAVADGAVTLELLREGGGALDSTRVERVAYRLREGRLERGFGALLATPSVGDLTSGGVGMSGGGTIGEAMSADAAAAASAASAASAGATALPLSNAPLVWQPLLADVAAVQYRAWVRQRGWADPATLAAAQAVAAASTPAARPPAGMPSGTPPGQGAPGAQGAQGAQGVSGVNANAEAARAAEAVRAAAENAAAAVEVTGIEMILVRRDGQRFVRVFPVAD